MPWKVADVEEHVKGLSDKQKEAWVKIANSSLVRCEKDQGTDCEATAIKTASAMAKNMAEDGELDWLTLANISEAATVKAQAQRLMRDVDVLLQDKTIPAAVRSALDALHAALKKTWADLADESANGPKPREFPIAKEADVQEAAVTKTVAGEDVPASCFLVVEDPAQPSTWHLQVKDPDGTPNHTLMEAAWAALTKGYRGNKYEGANKQKAMTKLKALYKAEDMPMPMGEKAELDGEHSLSEQDTGYEAKKNLLVAAIQASPGWPKFNKTEGSQRPQECWIRDLFDSYVIYEDYSKGELMKRSYVIDDTGKVTLGDATPVIPVTQYVAKTAESATIESGFGLTEDLAESAGGIEILSEGSAPADGKGPLTLKVALIEPGFGNAQHNHYYSAEMLKRDAGLFRGAKMYETDHNQTEKSTRTWVSTIVDIAGFTPTGAPIGEVVVHDPGFADRVRNLKSAGLLDKMACSILANGSVKSGKVGERKAGIVEAITSVSSVDWVTKAGAGGRALDIAEADTGTGNTDPKPEEVNELNAVEILTVLYESGLPVVAQKKLAGQTWADDAALKAAIEAEKVYLAEVALKPEPVAEGGKPFAQGAAKPAETSGETDKSLAERESAIIKRFLG